MLRLDAQVHSWYSDRPSRPWSPFYRKLNWEKPTYLQHAGQTNSPEMVKAEMAEAEVDGALLTPVLVYGVDIEMELEAAERDPGTFQVIGVVDHLAPDVGLHLERSRSRGLRGVRLLEMREPDRVARGEFDAVLQACSDLGLVVTFSLAHPVDPQLPVLINRYKNIFFYIDHLGTGYAPPILGWRPASPFHGIPAVLQLAELQNVGVKVTGAPSLSTQPYPFEDVWEPIKQLVDAYGADRCSWGADYTRTAGLCSYWQGTHYLAEIPGFGVDQLELLYAGTLMARTGWRPKSESVGSARS